jgi:hypothetical protein
MALSLVQHGFIVQQEYAKFLMMGSGGLIEVAVPLTDDERRDNEIHERGQYSYGLATQVKSTARLLQKYPRGAHYISVRFPVRASRVVNHPRFWYFIAYLDLEKMGLGDPTFLIPSAVFHKEAERSRKGEFWYFSFWASMEPESQDKWRPYRVETHQLGKRVLEIMADLKKEAKKRKRLLLLPPLAGPDMFWLRKAA